MSPEPVFHPQPKTWRPAPGTLDTSLLQDLEDLKDHAVTSSGLHPEGYRIELDETRCMIEVGSKRALRYAWMHLRQLQGDHPEKTPCGCLEDHPVMDRRAFMLDISRCKVPTRDGLRQWLKLLSEFRYNELQLYTEHTFAYRNHREVWEEASPMTAEDVVWLEKEADHLGIRLVANQNCFGHFERWLKHKTYEAYAESPEGFTSPWGDFRPVGSVLKPDDASFALVCELLDELLPLFESARVNIGCDETFELGQGASKARCEKEGTGTVYADFVQRIMRHVEEHHGKQPEIWGDILLKHPNEIHKLTPKASALCWGYEADSPLAHDCEIYAQSGIPFTVCPGTSSWRSFAGRTDNMIQNISDAAQAAVSFGAEGMLLTDWGDCGHLQQEPVSYGPLALFALLAWCGPDAEQHIAWEWCDQVAFQDQQGETACWLEAGRVSERTGSTPSNSNQLFQWFLFPDTQTGESVSSQTLAKVKAHLDQLPSPTLFEEEWDQTLRNLAYSLQRVEDHRTGAQTSKTFLPELRSNHARIWLKRNREGGLAESLQHYT